MTPLQKLLTTGEVAERLAVHPETVRRWVAQGKLSAVRLPSGVRRYRAADVDRLLGEPEQVSA